MKTITPTQPIALKLLQTVDAGLCAGIGNPEPGEMCMVAAKRFAFNLSHGDDLDGLPIGAAVRSFDICLNDSSWSGNASRSKGMRRLALAELGSDTLDQQQFSERLALKTIQKIGAQLFREMVKLAKTDGDKKTMEHAAADCENALELNATLEKLAHALARALDRAHAHAHAHARPLAHARALALAHAHAHARPLAHARDLARAHARALARPLALALALARPLALALALARPLALARDLAVGLILDLEKLAYALALAENYDMALAQIAEIAVEVLTEMKCPGCAWLELCEA